MNQTFSFFDHSYKKLFIVLRTIIIINTVCWYAFVVDSTSPVDDVQRDCNKEADHTDLGTNLDQLKPC